MENTTDCFHEKELANVANVTDIRWVQHPPSFVISVCMVTLNAVALLLNLVVAVTVVGLFNLRKLTSSVFLVFVCCVDIFASAVGIHKFIMLLEIVPMRSPFLFYVISAFLDSLSAYLSILSIILINIDKFYSIKFTMHYANNATKPMASIFVIISLIVSFAWACVPVFLEIKDFDLLLYVLWRHNKVYLSLSFTILYVIPLILMCLMSGIIFHVAKKSKIRICVPAQGFCNDNERMAEYSNMPCSIMISNNSHKIEPIAEPSEEELTNSVMCTLQYGGNTLDANDHQGRTSRLSIDHPRDHMKQASSTSASQSSIPAIAILAVRALTPKPFTISPAQNVHVRLQRKQMLSKKKDSGFYNARRRKTPNTPTHFKAIKNLIIPLLYFALVWGLYFIRGFWQVDSFSDFIGIVVYISYVLNPIVFVISRRDVREEIAMCFDKFRHRSRVGPELMSEDQTFVQFLQATSSL